MKKESNRIFKCAAAILCAMLIFVSFTYAANRYGATAETEPEPEPETMVMRPTFVFEDYDPAIDEVGHKVDFGEGYFFLKGDIETYIEEGNVLNFRRMAEDHGHTDQIRVAATDELTADIIPECGSHVALHGAVNDSDFAYIEAQMFVPYCFVRIEFQDLPEERVITLEDGSKISQLAADVVQYVFETNYGESLRMKTRFLRLEAWQESARAKVKVLYDTDGELATWSDVLHTGIVARGNLFSLRETAESYGFLASNPIEGGGIAYSHYDHRIQQTSEIRVYGSWDDAERPYFEAQLGRGVTIWMSFPLAGDIFVMENGSKIPELMARAISLAMSSLSYYPEFFETRFDALDKTAPTGVLADVYLRTKTDPEEVIRAENPEEQPPVVTNFSDGWISTQEDVAAYISDGCLHLRTLAHGQGWRVDPAMTGEMALFPQTNSFGYMVLSSYNIKIYGGGKYAYVLLSGPWYRIRVEFEQLAEGGELVKLENGDLVPERAGRVVLKALEILNGEDPRSIYETFEGLKETCPNGVTMSMNHFT